MATNPKILAALKAMMANKTADSITGGPTGGTHPTPVTPPLKPGTISINDSRTINPATGLPFSTKGGKTTNVDPSVLKAIIAHAKAKGVDPYTALAIGLQETEFGKKNPNIGSAWTYDADKNIPTTDTLNVEANRMANAIKDKLAYGAHLQKTGKIKQGEDFALQAYNGYGNLASQLMEVGGKKVPQKFYGIDVSAEHPLILSQNPAYGKTVISLRDKVLKTHPGVKALVDSTPAYGLTAPIPTSN